MGVLNGYRVSATEADVRAAERAGDIKKREAIQTADVEAALRCATVAEANAAGNEHFKAGAHSKALACYARARVLLDSEEAAALAAGASEDDEDDKVAMGAARSGTMRAVLLSNSAAALLRLERPAEALQAGLEALSAAPPRSSEPLSKIQYRLAHAYEQLQRYDEAIEAMRRSLEHARGEAVEAPSRAVEAPSRALEAPYRALEAPYRAVEAARGALHPSSLEWSAASASATTTSASTATMLTPPPEPPPPRAPPVPALSCWQMSSGGSSVHAVSPLKLRRTRSGRRGRRAARACQRGGGAVPSNRGGSRGGRRQRPWLSTTSATGRAGRWLRDWGTFDTLDTARAQLSGRRGIGWTMSAPR
jgi:hypothetical protein